ncbi:MAG: hypothetical protein IKX86_00215 [Clostridia bacterium]|nr:hypothetical protein [Clostridia bacterium]
MDGTVFFISELRAPDDPRATSTHIMTYTVLRGIRENGLRTVLFAICEDPGEAERLSRLSPGLTDVTTVLPSRFGGIKKGDALTRLIRMLSTGLRAGFYKKIDVPRFEKPSIILTHCPSVEAAYYGDELHRLFPGVPYYQFWSDPLAMSGLTPETVGPKRLPFRLAEGRALKHADRIIYGTAPLCACQKKLYPRLASKMFYSDVPCSAEETDGEKDPRRAVYAGNYYTAFRDIRPLVSAAANDSRFTLDIFGEGDVPDPGVPNVVFHGRVPPGELSELTKTHGISVCVLNSGCVQIPGKVFYEAGSGRRVLVVRDGRNPYSGMICDYLTKYGAFAFCDNDEKSLSDALSALASEGTAVLPDVSRFGPRAVSRIIIDGGLGDD